MTVRQSLELRNHQQLALTPQLQQSIRMLQLSAQELDQEIAQAILDNPLLEQLEECDIDQREMEPEESDAPRDEWPTSALPNRSADPYADWERPETAQTETLGQHLLRQLRLTRAGPRDLALTTLLIEELDENGYLPTALDDIAQYLPSVLEVDVQELGTALRLLQSFDPVGVGARSLAECLLLQMAAAPMAQRCAAPVLQCARQLAERHLDLLATGNLARLREALGCTQDVLRQAHALLLSLEPRPCQAWAGSQADYVNPEVLVHKSGRRWLARLNPAALPKLRVNADLTYLLGQVPRQGLLHEQLQQAHGLIKYVHQRFDTVLRVAQTIVDRQQAFFEHGAHAMRPLLLRDIAQALDMHESTVSRATRQKYVATPCGVLELKYFFGGALDTDDGQATSATAVRSLIAKLVLGESSKKPLSDSQIAASQGEQGVTIARRTVAKYREAAGIEPASMRRARATLA